MITKALDRKGEKLMCAPNRGEGQLCVMQVDPPSTVDVLLTRHAYVESTRKLPISGAIIVLLTC